MKVGDLVREIKSGSSRDLEVGIVVEIMHFPANDYAPIQIRFVPLGESRPTLHQRNARFYEVIG